MKLSAGETDPGFPKPAVATDRREPSAETTHSGPRNSAGGALRLAVTPADAEIRLDGDRFGTGGELSRLHKGIVLAPGKHTIEASLAGYRTRTVEVDLLKGEEKALRIDLEPR